LAASNNRSRAKTEQSPVARNTRGRTDVDQVRRDQLVADSSLANPDRRAATQTKPLSAATQTHAPFEQHPGPAGGVLSPASLSATSVTLLGATSSSAVGGQSDTSVGNMAVPSTRAVIDNAAQNDGSAAKDSAAADANGGNSNPTRRIPWHRGFTLEEEQYRTLYGWGALSGQQETIPPQGR